MAARHQGDVAALRSGLGDAAERQPLDGRQRGCAMTPAQRSDQLRDEFMGRQASQGAIRLALGARSPQGVEQVYGFHCIGL